MKAPIAILFANLKGNLGDFAILQAMLEDLSARFPGHPLHVVPHPFTPINEEDLAVFRASAPSFELIGPPYLIRFPFYLKWMTRYGIWKHIQAAYVRRLSAKIAKDAAKFGGYEAVIAAGGDQWGGSNPGTSMFGAIKAISRYNDRIYAYPFSLSPHAVRLNAPAALKDYFGTLRQPVVVRDAMTRELMRSCNIDPTLGVDCVFSLQKLAEQITPAPSRDPSRVMVIITGRANRLPLRSLIANLKGNGIAVELLSTSPPEDAEWFNRLGQELGVPVWMPRSWQEAVAELKASSLVITNRLHAMIFSCFGEAAVLPVADRPKAGALANDMRLPHIAADIAHVSPELIRTTLNDRERVVGAMHAYRARSLGELWHPAYPS